MTSDDRVGQTLLGKLRVRRVLGQGGAGVVYEVEHLLTGHRRALKVLRQEKIGDARAVARLLREASIAGRVGSPRLAETYDVGQLEDGAFYLLMELLEGRSLAERLRAGPMPQTEAIRIGVQIGEGLIAAHAAGVVHRDLTPRNVMLVPGPGGEEVKLVDFGLSRMLPGHTDKFGRLTATGAVVGTPHYLSPEQARSEPADARADQYALGVILYECLTGQRPYPGSSITEILAKLAAGERPSLAAARPDLDLALVAAIDRAMSARPEDRHGDVSAFLAALSQQDRGTAPLDSGAYRATDAGSAPAAPRSHDPAAFSATAPLSASGTEPVDPRGYAATEPVSSSSGDRRPAPAGPGAARGGAAPPPRLGRTVAIVVGLAAAAGLVLAVTFAATSFVLERMGAASAGAPATGGPRDPLDDEQNVRRLQDLMMTGRYGECLEEGRRMPNTRGVIEVLVVCANGAEDRGEVARYCQMLGDIDPALPHMNETCLVLQGGGFHVPSEP